MKSMPASVRLSVVVPVYGCADCLVELHRRLGPVLRRLVSSYEIVLVDDGSLDAGWKVIADLANRDPAVRGLRLSRNFGQHAAITAGLAHAGGDWTVVMDCDLQEEPEEIAKLWERAQEGFDVVLGRRRSPRHGALRRLAAGVYSRLLNLAMGTRVDGSFGTFSLISRPVREAFLEVRDLERHYLHVLHWLGFRPAVVEVSSHQRYAGRSSYDLRRLVAHAFNGVFFQTTTLLRWIIYLGFAVAGAGVLGVAYLVHQYLVARPPAGWTSVMVMMLVMSGFIIVSTGLTGLYVGKVFQQVKGRPLYIVEATVGHETTGGSGRRHLPWLRRSS